MEVNLCAGFVRFYCSINLEKYNRLALHGSDDNFCMHTAKGFSLHPFAFPRKSSLRLSHILPFICAHLWFEKAFPNVLILRQTSQRFSYIGFVFQPNLWDGA
jgi:hypothetical protein